MKTSVIIPSRNEKYLSKTVDDIFNKATGDIEVIVFIDGEQLWPLEPRKDLITITASQSVGLKKGLNTLMNVASGEYLLKTDAHCMFSKGFDETLKLNMEDDWMVVPSRYSLDPDKWTKFKGPIHYMYMVYPYKKTNKIGNGLHPKKWKDDPERNIGWWTLERKYKNKRIDDIMTSLGNCWFVNKKHLIRLGGITGENNSTLVPEDEITLKYWLSGGRVVVNKDVWVAHWWQSSGKRGYDVRLPEFRKVAAKMVYYWMNDKWPMQKRKMEWLIEKFWPIPEWPKDWKDGKNKYEKINMNLYKEMEGV